MNPPKPRSLGRILDLQRSVFTGPREEACLGLVLTGGALLKRADRFLYPWGITASQVNVLMVVLMEGGKEGLSQMAVGRRLVLSRANVSIHVKRLAGRGLLRKAPAPGSAREHRITLTAEARRLLSEVEPKYNAEVTVAMKGLSAADSRALCALLAKLWGAWAE